MTEGTEITAIAAGQRYVTTLEALTQYYTKRGLANLPLTETEARFATALARYRLAAPPGKMLAERLHVMVVGGAGCGKSTVANILVGASVAEVNPQAGFTRHPTAFLRSDAADHELWPDHLGGLLRENHLNPGNVDRDIFCWRRLKSEPIDPGFLRRHVVWDCPDLTTKDAVAYQTRVIEIAGLAEVVVYVASDERYNDELPTSFLQGLLEAGKWVIVVLTKVDADEAEELEQLFHRQVASRLTHAENIIGTVTIPNPGADRVDALWTDAFPWGMRLRELVETATGDFATCKKTARSRAVAYLADRQSRLLEPVRGDLGEWETWIELVRQGANDAVRGYESRTLLALQRREVADLSQRVLQRLRLPAPLVVIDQVLDFIRVPCRWLRQQWSRWRLAVDRVDEDQALERVRRGLLDGLQVACAGRKGRHTLWAELRQELQSPVPQQQIERTYRDTRDRQRREFQQHYRLIEGKLDQAFPEDSIVTAAVRGGRLALDVTIVAASLVLTQYSTIAVIPIIVGIGMVEELIAWMTRQFVQSYQGDLSRRRKEQARELIEKAYVDILVQMPRSTGRQLFALSQLASHLPKELEAVSGHAVKEAAT